MTTPLSADAVTSSVDATTGEATLVFRDADGGAVSVVLTLELQSRVLAALLAKTPGPQQTSQDQFYSRTLRAIGIQPFRLASGHPALQFLVGPSQAIDIAFPQESVPMIQKCLAQLASGQPMTQGPKH